MLGILAAILVAVISSKVGADHGFWWGTLAGAGTFFVVVSVAAYLMAVVQTHRQRKGHVADLDLTETTPARATRDDVR